MMTLVTTLITAAVLPPAWASLASWGSWLAGANMARRRLIRASQWAAGSTGCLIAFAAAGLPWAILAASMNLAIGLILLGRVAARRVRQS